MKKLRVISLLLALVMVIGCMMACGNEAETNFPGTDAPETNAPETDAPETDAPETDAPETDAPETDPPETDAPAPDDDLVKTIFTAAADTYVQMNSTDDFGSADKLFIKSADSSKLTRRAFIRFDLSELEISEIESVTLRLYCLYASKAESEIAARDYKLYTVSHDWKENGMVWSSQPALGDKVTDIETGDAKKGAWIEVDVTDYVKSNLATNLAFAIVNDGPDSSENHLYFGTREVEGQGSQLVVNGKYVEGSVLPVVDNSTQVEDSGSTEEDEPFAVLVSVADTYVQANSTDDFGSADRLFVKSADTKRLSRRAYVRFDMSDLKISEIDKVTLRLYCKFASPQQAEIAARNYKLYAVSSDWNESGMIWGFEPAVLQKVADIDTTAAQAGAWIEIDVTEYVKTNFYEKLSFMICNEGPETEENHLYFGSREAIGMEPQLVFEGTYEEGRQFVSEELPEFVCEDHKAYLRYELPTATTNGYIMRACYICGELLDYEILAADPSVPQIETATIIAKADTYVQKNKGTTNYGGEEKLRVKTDEAGKLSRQALITFNTLNATEEEIDSVILRLYCTFTSTVAADKANRDYKLYAVSSDWKEMSVTWDNQPVAGEKVANVNAKTVANDVWLEIDVTDYVKAHLGEAVSFVLLNEAVDTSEGHVDFASREKGEGYAPQLVFEGTFDPDAAMPVEPELSVLTPSADLHFQQGKTSAFNETKLFVKSDNNGNTARRAYLLFDTTDDEIANVTVKGAKLRLFCWYANAADAANRKEYKLYATVSDTAWAETGSYTYAAPPVSDDVCIATLDLSALPNMTKEADGTWIEIDVSDYIAANLGKQITFSIRNEGTASDNNHVYFSSKEATNKPQLVVEYLPAVNTVQP